MDSRLPLKVKIWTSQREYKKGEHIEVFMQGNRDFYARVVDITSSGDIVQLLPNDYRKNNFFRSGRVFKIPDKGDVFQLNVSPPYGVDTIVVFASEVPLGNVNLEPAGQGLNRYRGSRGSLATQNRGIHVDFENTEEIVGAEFYEATLSLRTSSKD